MRVTTQHELDESEQIVPGAGPEREPLALTEDETVFELGGVSCFYGSFRVNDLVETARLPRAGRRDR